MSAKLKVWELQPNEHLIKEADAYYITTRLGFLPKPNPGKLHVTDQRVLFTDLLTLFFDYPLNQILSFSVGMGNTITLATDDGKTHKITGMFNKKLIQAMEQAGVKKA